VSKPAIDPVCVAIWTIGPLAAVLFWCQLCRWFVTWRPIGGSAVKVIVILLLLGVALLFWDYMDRLGKGIVK